MTNILNTHPMDLWPTDRVVLAQGVVLSGTVLEDLPSHRSLTLNGSAAAFVSLFDGKRSLEETAAVVADANDWDRQQLTNDLAELVDELDRQTVVRIHRPVRSYLTSNLLVTLTRRYILLDWPRPPARRYRPQLGLLAWSCVRANSWGLLASALMSILLFGILLSHGVLDSGSPEKLGYAATPLALFATLLLQLFFHEAGHMLALRWWGQDHPFYVIVRGIRVSIAHAGLSPEQARKVAFAGPVAGFAVGTLLAVVALLVPQLESLAVLLGVTSLLQLLSCLPWTADGKMMWRKA